MKSTDPLSLSTKSFNLETNSASSKGLVSQQDAKNSLSSKPELVTEKMLDTSNKVENNGCDTQTHTVEVHVHQVNGYSNEDNDGTTSLGQQKLLTSPDVARSGQQKLLTSPDVARSEQHKLLTSPDVARSGDLMNGRSDLNCVGSVNGSLGSDVKRDSTKINSSSRDSAVFDVDLTIGDEVHYFSDVSNPKSDSGRLGVEEKQEIPVKVNGVSLINGEDNHLQESSSLQRSKEIKTVSADVEQSQKDKNGSSFFSTNGMRDSFKNVKKAIVGCNGLSNTAPRDGVLKNGVLQSDGVGVSVTKYSNGSHLTKASSLESLSDNGGRFERDSEMRRSKSSMNGFCSGRSRSDPDEDLDDLLLLPGGRQNNEGYDNLPVDSGVESAASSWDRMAEVKESAHARLQEELRKAYHKLKLKDEEVSRLSRIRNEVEAELEELTASLFQEAHNMVREANVQQAAAEKALKESQMQIDVLTAEVSALKTLVLTSTPSRPNPHLHPQIDPRSKDDQNSNGSGLFRKQHRRSPSHFNLKYGRENSPPDSPAKEPKVTQNPADTNDGVDMVEVDPNFHRDFLAWKQSPTLQPDDPFIAKIFREDIDGCLEFNNSALAERVRESINNESICIEVVNEKSRSQFPMKCALLEVIRQCHYRMKFDGCDQTYCISQLCRNRITAVCNFLNYLRYIQRGLVKSSAHEIYWEIARLRKEISLARLGLTSNQ